MRRGQGRGRGYGVWAKFLFWGLFATMAGLILYEMVMHGFTAFVNRDYIMITIGAFVLVFVAMVIRARTCRRTPRGPGWLKNWFW